MKLAERIAALEDELVADPADEGPIIVRMVSGRVCGREFTDNMINALRHSDGVVTMRLPGEALPALVARAGAAAPTGHPRRRLVFLAVYSQPDASCRIRT